MIVEQDVDRIFINLIIPFTAIGPKTIRSAVARRVQSYSLLQSPFAFMDLLGFS